MSDEDERDRDRDRPPADFPFHCDVEKGEFFSLSPIVKKVWYLLIWNLFRVFFQSLSAKKGEIFFLSSKNGRKWRKNADVFREVMHRAKKDWGRQIKMSHVVFCTPCHPFHSEIQTHTSTKSVLLLSVKTHTHTKESRDTKKSPLKKSGIIRRE